MYIGIIGGGITGLYCALKLSEKHKIILFDDRNYIGGRIYTKNQLEMGAARFNNTHKNLLSLIQKYNLSPIEIPSKQNYLLYTNECNSYTNSDKIFKNAIEIIIQKTKISEDLRNISFYEHIKNILKSEIEARLLVSVFGYYTEIMELNAYDAIETFKNDFAGRKYYILQEGLSTLCEQMKNTIIKNGSKVCLNEKVKGVKDYCIITIKQNIKVDKIIFCTKARELNKFKILSPIHKYLDCLYEAKLIRIYAKYKKCWFNDLPRITTNNVLRQIIPIDKKNGIIMVSYVDGNDTNIYLKNNKLKSEIKIRKIIIDNLALLFPNKHIEEPIWIEPYFWEVGTHAWKPGCDSQQIYETILNPIKDIYICGEAYSKKQAWIEGGLCMANDVLKKII